MSEKNYNRSNFHKHTFCVFTEVPSDGIATLELGYKSKSGSCYYFTSDGVYRLSDHWGRAANCRWRLVSVKEDKISRTKIGFAKWTDFHPDNDSQKLYFIAANYESQSVQFYHKESENYTSDVILRTSAETMKRIKHIRVLFEETAWAKYLKEEDISTLRREIIQKLIDSDVSFQEIRREYL